MKNAIIIDDEFDARRVLRKFLEKYCTSINVLGESDSVSGGIEIVKQCQPDVLFLDVHINNGTGFQTPCR